MNEKDIFQDKEYRKWLKEKFGGWTDDDIDNLTTNQRNFLLNLYLYSFRSDNNIPEIII